jgi:hypothetical protein
MGTIDLRDLPEPPLSLSLSYKQRRWSGAYFKAEARPPLHAEQADSPGERQ